MSSPSDMSDPSEVNSDLAFVADVMQAAIKVMSGFPKDFVPPDVELPETGSPDAAQWMRGKKIVEILSDTRTQAWLNDIMDTWPNELLPVFLQSSSILANILEGFGAREEGGAMDMWAIAMSEPDTLQLMMALGQIKRETEALEKDGEDDKDPLGFKQAATNEIFRRTVAYRTPFARTLTTLLGQDALLWLTAESEDGFGKIQPHEFSRTGWHKIWAIENQLRIEQELMNLEPEAEYLGKIVVALSWTLVGLASFIQPAVFFGEQTSHLISAREGKYTVASGTSSHTLVAFQPAAMLPLLRILEESLTNPLLSAADMMWIAAGLARVREVRSGPGEAMSITPERFDLFLSHRGRDAKRSLSLAVQALQPMHGVFLDCLTLPRGVINRSFVFGSLARSERVLIVETENFNESDWCRKEAWLADTMATHGLARVERLTLPGAAALVAADGPASTRQRSDQGLHYPIAGRVLKDIDYWARAPNLYSLKETGHSTESLAPLQAALENEERPEDPAWVRSIGETVADTLSRVVEAAPEAEPIDLWATALQLSLAAFGSTSYTLSKNEVRRGIDQLNAVLRAVVTAKLHCDPVFKAQAAGHLALLAAASAIDLAGFDLDPRMIPALRIAIGDAAGLGEGLLLLDVREPGARRDFRLRLVAAMIQGNLGSVGIVQDAADEVHQLRIDALPLEVLPCVTLYPGMAAPFGFESSSSS